MYYQNVDKAMCSDVLENVRQNLLRLGRQLVIYYIQGNILTATE